MKRHKIKVRTKFTIHTGSSDQIQPHTILTPYFSTFGHLSIPTHQPSFPYLTTATNREGVKASIYFLLPMLGNSVA